MFHKQQSQCKLCRNAYARARYSVIGDEKRAALTEAARSRKSANRDDMQSRIESLIMSSFLSQDIDSIELGV